MSISLLLQRFNKVQLDKAVAEKKFPSFKSGDVLKVGLNIRDGAAVRVQFFEGICISIRNAGLSTTFIVRKIASGEHSVEKNLLLYLSDIESIEVVRKNRTRRAKLYYLRDRFGKSARMKEDVSHVKK